MTYHYKELTVWKDAMALVTKVYTLARTFPKHEQFALTNQLTRAVVSIPANIAEGNRRATTADYAHFIAIARGSLAEVETLLLIAVNLEYLSAESLVPLEDPLDKLGRMLTSLHQKLKPTPAQR